MKVVLGSLVFLSILGCGGSTAPGVTATNGVVGKWLLDMGDGAPTLVRPPEVEFRADGTYAVQSIGSNFESTYSVKDEMLSTADGLTIGDRKEYVFQNDNAGSLRLIESGPPPANSSYWRKLD